MRAARPCLRSAASPALDCILLRRRARGLASLRQVERRERRGQRGEPGGGRWQAARDDGGAGACAGAGVRRQLKACMSVRHGTWAADRRSDKTWWVQSVDELMSMPDIDGCLVGGASLDPAKFTRIMNFQ